jgi:hypothetical protein
VGVLSGAGVIALATVLLVVFAGGNASRGKVSVRKNAAASVLTAVNSSLANKTADLTITMTKKSGGTTSGASGTGVVNFTDDALRLDLSTTGSGQQTKEKAIFLKNALYVSIPDLGQLVPGKAWLSIDLSGVENAGKNAGESLDNGENPVAMLRLLAAEGNTVTPLGSSTVDGQRVQGYAVSIDVTKLEAGLTKLPSWMRLLIAGTDVGGISYKIYIGSNDLLRRVTVAMDMSIASSPVSESETLDLTHYGVPVTVTAPPLAQVMSFQQFLSTTLGSSPPSSSSTPSNACTETPPAGASDQAVAYIKAVNADYPDWLQVTQMIESDGDNVNLQILQLQSHVDTNFLDQLRSIRFKGAAVEPAGQLEADLSSYLSDMATAEASSNLGSSALWSRMDAVSDDRSDASSALRTALGLPQSSCDVERP